MLSSILRAQYDYAAACLDRVEPTFRHKKYDAYKAHRPPVPDALIQQLPAVYEMIESYGIRCLQKEGYEADDLLATLADFAEKEKMEAHIHTGDLDVLQVVAPHARVFIPAKGASAPVEYDGKKVMERFGITPPQVTDYKALVGDASDNIKGVPGIGPKTAAQLLNQYGTIEHLLERTGELPEKVRARLEEFRGRALLNKELVTLCRNVPVNFTKEELKYNGIQSERLMALFQTYELKTIAAQFMKNHNVTAFTEEENENKETTIERKKEKEDIQLELL